MKEADQMIYHGGFCFLCWSCFPTRLDDAESCHTLSIRLPPVLNPSQRQHINETEPPVQILTYQLYNARSPPVLRLWSNPASSLLPGRCVIFCSSARTSSRHATYSFSLRGMGQMGRQTNKIKFTGKRSDKIRAGHHMSLLICLIPQPYKIPKYFRDLLHCNRHTMTHYLGYRDWHRRLRFVLWDKYMSPLSCLFFIYYCSWNYIFTVNNSCLELSTIQVYFNLIIKIYTMAEDLINLE